MEPTNTQVASVMEAKIEANGFTPESIEVVQKAKDSWLCTVRFEGDDREYQGIITRDEVGQ